MKHIINYLGTLLAVVLIGTTFTACSDDDGNGSGNVGLGIKVFFPTKVVTNQPVTINGSGFLDVKEIEFPGGVKVTDFEIVSDEMIRVNTPAGIPADGGRITVHTDGDQATSRLPLTLGHTNVSGFSAQPGEQVTGGDLIKVYGSDLEFINQVELLDAEGLPQLIDHKDFYRKGTSTLTFRVPRKNIYEGTFTGVLHTYDGQKILMPELSYKPGSEGGHWETVVTSIWKNDGSLGDINWSSDYRFATEGHSSGEECYVIPLDIWERMKTETFYVTVKGDAPQIRVTSGWWSTTWTGNDIQPGSELLEDNGDGTWKLTVNLAGDPLLDLMDEQHLLFTGAGYSVQEIYFAEEVWVDDGGEVEVNVPIWTNDGSLGDINWSSDYRFATEGHSSGEECYVIPLDIWERMKTETFYVTVKGDAPQIRVTSGWWSTTWTGNDIQPGSELLEDNGDGTWKLTVNLAGDPLLDLMDEQHLLFTGAGYSVQEIYFIEIHQSSGGNKEEVFWENSGAGEVNWNGTYRFALEGHDSNNECLAEFSHDVWDRMKSSTFYLVVEATDPQIRVTTGWWDPSWAVGDLQPGNELLTDNGDGTWTAEINLAGDVDFVNALDDRHILFTGVRFTPLKLYFKK